MSDLVGNPENRFFSQRGSYNDEVLVGRGGGGSAIGKHIWLFFFLTGGNCGPLTCGPWEACKYPAVGTTTTATTPPPDGIIAPIVPIMPLTRQRRSLPHPVCVPMNSEFLSLRRSFGI